MPEQLAERVRRAVGVAHQEAPGGAQLGVHVGAGADTVGEDNVLWGTDSIWYGSPQDQIQAFRTFQIADALAQRHGYPKLTPALRAKVFGRNALALYPVPDDVLRHHLPRDRVARERESYLERPDPSFLTYGPKTRREFLALKARGG